MEHTGEWEDRLSVSLRNHVVSPLETAGTALVEEYDAVAAERAALESFGTRVAGVNAVSTTGGPPVTRAYAQSTATGAVRRVRNAFRETVMSLDHYGEAYGETLEEFTAAELSVEVATTFRGGTATEFTEFAKSQLVSAIDRSAEQRASFLDVLDDERDSLGDAETALRRALSEDRDGARPTDIRDRLDEVSRRRQRTLQRTVPTALTDGHDLCPYLYRDPEWTYPVLTAVARYRRALSV